MKQLTGARLSTMPIYYLLCHLKENCSPCFKEEYMLWLNWNQILKVNKISFCSFLFPYFSVYCGNAGGGISCKSSWLSSFCPLVTGHPRPIAVPGHARAAGAHSLHPPLWPPSLSSRQWVCTTKASFYMSAPSIFSVCNSLLLPQHLVHCRYFVNCKHSVVFHVADS